MEIYIDDMEKQCEFTKHFLKGDTAIKITSTDKQDKGKTYNILKRFIISIDNDCEGLIIWWKEYSVLEGKFFTNSAHFKKYTLFYETI